MQGVPPTPCTPCALPAGVFPVPDGVCRERRECRECFPPSSEEGQTPQTGFNFLPEEGTPSGVMAYAGAFHLALLELATLAGYGAPQYCAYCGKSFYPSRAGQRYCSKSCRNMASRQKARLFGKGP